MAQKILKTRGDYSVLDEWLTKVRRPMLVCDRFMTTQPVYRSLMEAEARLGIRIVPFTDFVPNPQYDSVVKGVEIFRREGCDSMIGIGGGSAMDVAKCVKMYATMPGNGEEGGFLTQKLIPNEIPFLAMPTTAGTGSEATRHAVIYYQGQKQSISDYSCIPETVLMDVGVLRTLPMYQKKATMMDALCHALESFWSVNSTEESKIYSKAAVRGVTEHLEGYLQNTDEGNEGMLLAAHMAGKAINIAQTTAGHAMCYKITSLFGCAHGHAAALCDRVLFPHMIRNTGKCIDPRGEAYLRETLAEIAEAMGCQTPEEAAERFGETFTCLELSVPEATEEQFDILKKGVNPVRLKNHPVLLDEETIGQLYHKILRTRTEESKA